MAKIKVTFKDPDAIGAKDLSAEERAAIAEFVLHGEYITIVFDTTHGTARERWSRE